MLAVFLWIEGIKNQDALHFKLEASVSEFNTITQTLISEVRVGRLLRHLLIVRKKKNKVFKNLK